MKFYRLHMTCENGISAGFRWFTTARDAVTAERQHRAQNTDPNAPEGETPGAPFEASCEIVNIEPTKAGILAALNAFASHADNG
jgi:hypothetical protein